MASHEPLQYEAPELDDLQKRDFALRDQLADIAWRQGIEAEKTEGMDAAVSFYEGSLRHRIGAVWWHKPKVDRPLDYDFYLRLGEVQTRLAAYPDLTPGYQYDRNTLYFQAAEKVYNKAWKRLLNDTSGLDDLVVNSLEALILSRRADMYTSWGHFNDAKEDLDLAEEDISSSFVKTPSNLLIMEQIAAQREVISNAEANNVIKAVPRTPPGFLLYVVTNTELAKI